MLFEICFLARGLLEAAQVGPSLGHRSIQAQRLPIASHQPNLHDRHVDQGRSQQGHIARELGRQVLQPHQGQEEQAS